MNLDDPQPTVEDAQEAPSPVGFFVPEQKTKSAHSNVPTGSYTFTVGKKAIRGNVTFIPAKGRARAKYRLNFSYCPEVLARVKLFDGRKWVADAKAWDIPQNARNNFQLNRLIGEKVYAKYDAPISTNLPFARQIYAHQKSLVAQAIQMRSVFWAAEMGCGKTLSDIEVLGLVFDKLTEDNCWFVAPRSALASVRLEFRKWKTNGLPRFLTYEAMTKLVSSWTPGAMPPQAVIFDEASRVKNPTSQRGQCALHLANSVRAEWGDQHIIILQTGTPAPKNPADWWHLAEIACPGFLAEGAKNVLEQTLAVVKMEEHPGGYKYPKILGWKDNDGCTCAVCAKPMDFSVHQAWSFDHHRFVPVTNEVAKLHQRLKGLVSVVLKKDCLDLPQKRYEIIRIPPSEETLRVADLLVKSAPRAAEALGRLRELSDGFRYRDIGQGTYSTCPCCKGVGEETFHFETVTHTDDDGEVYQKEQPAVLDYDIEKARTEGRLITETSECTVCRGKKVIEDTARSTEEFTSPKDEVLLDLLGQHEEVGRFVVFAGFQGSIDRIEKICQKEGWHVLRVDGTATRLTNPEGLQVVLPVEKGQDAFSTMIGEFQNKGSDIEQMVFVANPATGSTGLTLTRSPSILFYSNSFNGEDRTQAEDRIHRLGMDMNRGCTIYDLFHLPSDELVYKNIKEKRRLELLTIGEVMESLRD